VSPLSLVLAVAAAVCNALSSVLQRRANRDEQRAEQAERFSASVLLRLLQRPAWLGGFAALIISFLLQATALRFGSLAAVEPVLAAELPLTLLLAAGMLGARLARRDVAASVIMAAGLAGFLIAVGPSDSPPSAGREAQLLAALLTAGGVGALVAAGRFGSRRSTAAFYGAAAGSGFGLTAAMMKVTVDGLGSGAGVLTILSRWQLYAMVAAGLIALLLVQLALRAGTLVAVQPGLTLLDPLVSVVWGVAVLGETANSGSVLFGAAVGAAAMVGAALALSQSPALQGPG
jgi:drug/metabolite transporter (DMT)-like permease